MSVAERFAEFITRTRFEDLPPETVRFAKELTLKNVAGMLAGSAEPAAGPVLHYVREHRGTPQAGVIGWGFRTTVEHAALANGYFAHCSELEDDQFPGGGVSAITVWPALLPQAEHLGLSGREFLAAAVVGVEVQNRLAYHISAETDGIGIMGLSLYGGFGSVAAAAKACRLDYDATLRALGLALTQGIGYWLTVGTNTHFFESAAVCRNGVVAAQLAREGLTSNPDLQRWVDVWFGEGKVNLSRAVEGLREPPYFIHRIWVKKFPNCFFIHRHMDALAMLLAERAIPYEQVERVEAHIGPIESICDRPEPQTEGDLRFSYQHALGAVLLGEEVGLELFEESKLHDPRLREARAKVHTVYPPHWPRRYMTGGVARVELRRKDGTTHVKELDQSLGAPKYPLATEQFVEMYRKYT
ncbi:MAG: MmgE/PrpD family protein, partial [Nitrospinota bacterium]